MKVAFRTDASIQIGTGHVMRCLTLANELRRQGNECWFVCREHPGNLGDLIASQGHGLMLLPAPANHSPEGKDTASDDYAFWLGVPWQEDARQTLDVISSLKPDWLVVDHYALDAQWERSLSSVVGDIMVIDDLANRPHACTLILDQNLGRVASDYDGLLPAVCQRLIGPGFALVRREFAVLRKRSLERRIDPELKRILISLGGIDRPNVTGQVLEALATSSLPASTELDIIMGAYAPYLGEVRQQAGQLPFKATVSVNIRDMAERMCVADLSIGAAGGTSWERGCLGLPAVLIVLAENQVAGAEALETAGAAISVGDTLSVVTKLSPILMALSNTSRLMKMSKAAANITDGHGACSVAHTMSSAGR